MSKAPAGHGAVERLVHAAITERLRHPAPEALLHLTDDPDHAGAVIVHINSGGNTLAAKAALQRAGYRWQDLPPPADGYGSLARVLPPPS